MTLQHELTTLPKNAIIILRYMSSTSNGSAEYDEIQIGTGLSERATGKAVKRLVTRFFMRMDETRMYHVTPKGTQAIELLATNTDWVGSAEQPDTVTYDLCAVIPQQIGDDQPTKWMLGVSPAGSDLPEHPTELLLRISADPGTLTPTEAVISVSGQHPESYSEFLLVSPAIQNHIRIRIEAYQLLELDEPREAGGMYFDVNFGNAGGQMRAVHIPIELL